jgi:hypothetical protein
MVETPFDTMTKTGIQAGDIISITWKGSKNNFKVINNTSGQIIMDNIDTNSNNKDFRYFMVYTSLTGDDMEVRRVHKTNQANILNDPKKWGKFTFKDITNIEIIRDGKVVDKVDPLSPSAAKQQKNGVTSGGTETTDFVNFMNNNLGTVLEQLQEGKGLNLKLNNAEVIFCCIGKTGGVFDLEIIENKSLPLLNKWRTFVLDIKGDPNDNETSLYEANKDIIKTPDNGKTFSIKFKVITSDKESEIWISGGEGFAITKSCGDKSQEGEVDGEQNKVKDEEELKLDAKEAFEKILADPLMQKAFYSQPTFWQSFVAELRGKKHPGNGIITVLNIVKNYENNKLAEKVGEGFNLDKEGLIIEFVPLRPITLTYNVPKEGQKSFEIKTLAPTKIKTAKDKKETGLVLEVKLPEDPNYILRVIVDSTTEVENIKNCRLLIGRIASNNMFTAVSSPVTRELEFLNSDGYKIPKQEKTK